MYFSYGNKVLQRKINLFNICLVLSLFIGIDLSIIKLKPSLFSAAAIQRNDVNDLLLTLQEKETLKSFKEKVEDRLPEAYMKTDFYLIRWLRVKEYDVYEAERMLMLNIKWRQDNNISTVISEDFSDMREIYHSTTDTYDKEGRPICTVNLGAWDIRAAVVQGKLPRLTRYADHFLETLVQKILTAQQGGVEVTRALFLIDLEGFNLKQHTCPSCISIFVKLVLGLESHYPRFMEEIIIINSPPMFQLLLNGIGGVMTKDVKKTIKLLGNNKKQWMDYLDARVDRNQRYANFGGNKIA